MTVMTIVVMVVLPHELLNLVSPDLIMTLIFSLHKFVQKSVEMDIEIQEKHEMMETHLTLMDVVLLDQSKLDISVQVAQHQLLTHVLRTHLCQ